MLERKDLSPIVYTNWCPKTCTGCANRRTVSDVRLGPCVYVTAAVVFVRNNVVNLLQRIEQIIGRRTAQICVCRIVVDAEPI